MAEVTVNIPDPILNIIQKRADDTNNTLQGIIIANLAIIFGPVRYDSSKWLKSMPGDAPDYSVAWD